MQMGFETRMGWYLRRLTRKDSVKLMGFVRQTEKPRVVQMRETGTLTHSMIPKLMEIVKLTEIPRQTER